MSGEVVYVPPQPPHECQPGHLTGQGEAILPLGAVWRCGKCGAYWRSQAMWLVARSEWVRFRGVRLWWWKRRHGGAP